MRYTMVIAHPDDEVIFGWPVLKETKKIVCASSDLYNPERAWCKERKKALQEVGKLINAEIVCLDYNSEFYRANTRNGDLAKIQKDILAQLKGSDDYIFTHNAWGEYGHIDHILVNQFLRKSNKKIFSTSICLEAGWFSAQSFLNQISLKSKEIDIMLYQECKAIYDKYGCWTWSKEPITKVKIYENCNCVV